MTRLERLKATRDTFLEAFNSPDWIYFNDLPDWVDDEIEKEEANIRNRECDIMVGQMCECWINFSTPDWKCDECLDKLC